MHYYVHNSLQLDFILNQFNPVLKYAPYFLQTHFNIILLSSTSVSLK